MKRVISPLAVAMWVTAAFNALALDDAATNKPESSAYNQTSGVAIKGYDPVAYQTDNKALKGDAKFSATHNGVMSILLVLQIVTCLSRRLKNMRRNTVAIARLASQKATKLISTQTHLPSLTASSI